jgi:hypothetical protein
MTDRIPPQGEQLEFARNNKTGRVHILCYGPDRHWIPPTRADAGPAAEVLSMLTAPCRMLCGVRLLAGAFGQYPAVWMAGDSFADDDLCVACVQALGDQSWRAFHVDNRGSS